MVVPVIGDERCDKWLGKLGDVIHPDSKERRAAMRPVPGCPKFGDDSVVERPPKAPPKAKSVIPGLHKPLVGTHRVVWWDPGCLNLGVEETMGLRQRTLLQADESGKVSQSGVRDYDEWYTARGVMIERGIRPSRYVATATELALAAGRGEIAIPEGVEVSIEEFARDAARPRGPRFGALVHAILMSCGADARGDAIAKFAAMHARILGTTEADAAAAIDAVAHALASPLMRRASSAAQVRREAPVLIRLEDGAMVEGAADLAFLERDGWTVVDFKTDAKIAPRLDEYRAQLGLYVRGIRAASGRAARGVLLWM